MNVRQRLTICALLLTCQHDVAVSLPFCKDSHPNAVEPEEDVNFPNVGNRWIAERHHENVMDNNISNNTSQSLDALAIESVESFNLPAPQPAAINQIQEPQSDISNTITRTQSATAVNARTRRNNQNLNQAAPTTTQRINNHWQQAYQNQPIVNNFMPGLTRHPQYLHGNTIFPTSQILELNPNLNAPSRGGSNRAQRLISTRGVFQPDASAHVDTVLPLHGQWSIPGNTFLTNLNSHRSASSGVQRRPSSIRNVNSFTYLFD